MYQNVGSFNKVDSRSNLLDFSSKVRLHHHLQGVVGKFTGFGDVVPESVGQSLHLRLGCVGMEEVGIAAYWEGGRRGLLGDWLQIAFENHCHTKSPVSRYHNYEYPICGYLYLDFIFRLGFLSIFFLQRTIFCTWYQQYHETVTVDLRCMLIVLPMNIIYIYIFSFQFGGCTHQKLAPKRTKQRPSWLQETQTGFRLKFKKMPTHWHFSSIRKPAKSSPARLCLFVDCVPVVCICAAYLYGRSVTLKEAKSRSPCRVVTNASHDFG